MFSLIVSCSRRDVSGKPVFFLNGEQVDYYFKSINGTPETVEKGDVVGIDRINFVLTELRDTMFFSTDSATGNLLFLEEPENETRRPVAARITSHFIRDTTVEGFSGTTVIDVPFDISDSIFINSLNGITFDRFKGYKECEKIIRLLSSDNTYISISYSNSDTVSFSDLNKELRYLQLKKNSSATTFNYKTLSHLTNLVFLDIDDMREKESLSSISYMPLKYLALSGVEIKDPSKLNFWSSLNSFSYSSGNDSADFNFLSHMKNLKLLSLSIWGESFEGIEYGFAGMQNLEYLDFSYSSALTDLNFLRSSYQLKHLDISGTNVTSLTALEDLQSLQFIKANKAPIKTLPQSPLKSLDTLELLSTEVTDEDVLIFKDKNPDCTVFSSWGELLKASLTGSSKLRIRSGGTCHRRKSKEKVLAEINSITTIDSIINLIEIDGRKSGDHCMCCGSMVFEFFKDSTMHSSLGYHHEKSFRWPEGNWPGDGVLTEESSKKLKQWVDNMRLDPNNESFK